MINIISIDPNDKFKEQLEGFLGDVTERKITHAVVSYRNDKGDLKFFALGHEHMTFLVGMLHRVSFSIHGMGAEE